MLKRLKEYNDPAHGNLYDFLSMSMLVGIALVLSDFFTYWCMSIIPAFIAGTWWQITRARGRDFGR